MVSGGPGGTKKHGNDLKLESDLEILKNLEFYINLYHTHQSYKNLHPVTVVVVAVPKLIKDHIAELHYIATGQHENGLVQKLTPF